MIYIDPPTTLTHEFLNEYFGQTGLIRRVIRTPHDIRSFRLNEIEGPIEQSGMFRSTGNDPWIDIPVFLAAHAVRFCVVTITCVAKGERGQAQIFWNGDKRAGYNEDLSVIIPLDLDGREHTYLIDLHEGSFCGAINYRWRHHRSISSIRFDPLNKPGEFLIRNMTLLNEDYFINESLRIAVGLAPVRRELSFRYLNGCGVEVGALQNPLSVPPTSYVQYADKFTHEEARREYPELSESPLVNPTIICEATALDLIDRSMDFVIANHVLEHMPDPLAAIREWLRVLRYGGHLYVAVPEHTNPLDKYRSVTTLEHMVADFENREKRTSDDLAHFSEWVASAHAGLPPEEQARIESDRIARNYAIHFHTFSHKTFRDVLEESTRRFGGRLLEYRVSVHPELVEFIAIVRRE